MDYSLIGIFLGNKCNLECDHCIPSSSIKNNGSLTNSEAEDLIGTIKKYKIPWISFTGGEPLLYYREQMLKIQKRLDSSIKYRITTNGTFTHTSKWRSWLDELEVSELRLSKDKFHDNEICWDDALLLLNYCKSKSIRLVVEVVISDVLDICALGKVPSELRSLIKIDKALKCGRALATETYFRPPEFSLDDLRGGCPFIEDKILMYYQGRGYTVCCNNISETKMIPKNKRYFDDLKSLERSPIFKAVSQISNFKEAFSDDINVTPELSLKCNFCEYILGERFGYTSGSY